LALITATVSASCCLGLKLDELAARLGRGHVTRGHVKGIARLVDLLVVRVADRDLARQHVSPVQTLAAVPGQPLEHQAREWLSPIVTKSTV
jgi:hypothetical protein